MLIGMGIVVVGASLATWVEERWLRRVQFCPPRRALAYAERWAKATRRSIEEFDARLALEGYSPEAVMEAIRDSWGGLPLEKLQKAINPVLENCPELNVIMWPFLLWASHRNDTEVTEEELEMAEVAVCISQYYAAMMYLLGRAEGERAALCGQGALDPEERL